MMKRPSEMRELTEDELAHIADRATCPYCQGTLLKGPRAGACENLLCVDLGCHARFNLCSAFDHPVAGQYIGQDFAAVPIYLGDDERASAVLLLPGIIRGLYKWTVIHSAVAAIALLILLGTWYTPIVTGLLAGAFLSNVFFAVRTYQRHRRAVQVYCAVTLAHQHSPVAVFSRLLPLRENHHH